MIRKIITIDEENCIGCGICAEACTFVFRQFSNEPGSQERGD